MNTLGRCLRKTRRLSSSNIRSRSFAIPTSRPHLSHRLLSLSRRNGLLRRQAISSASPLLQKHHQSSEVSTEPPDPAELAADNYLSGSLGQYMDAMYEKWISDPLSVDSSFDSYFRTGGYSIDNIPSPTLSPLMQRAAAAAALGGADVNSPEVTQLITDAANAERLMRAYRAFGHFVAKLDPLEIFDQGANRRNFVPALLSLEEYGFSETALERKIFVGANKDLRALVGTSEDWVTLKQIVDRLRLLYCGSIGYQYMHIANHQRNSWMRRNVEANREELTAIEKERILDRLTWAQEFEKFLALKWGPQKRFGIDGGEALVPLMKEVIDECARLGVDDFVIGMPHRGRLIVMATVLRKELEHLFHEFRGAAMPQEAIRESGDVKYHLGASMNRETPDGLKVHLSLSPNPSHLECVNPTVMGKTRAKQHYKEDNSRSKTVAILLHGDAAFAGQGVVYESMALTDIPDYTTGGVIHIIVNNQIGFTTDPMVARSSPYCTDVARSIAAPIMHVNGEDPEAVVKCAKTAARYRQEFKSDFVIDMLCYRRFGHNEGDEPSFTQPYMYQVINKKEKSGDTVLTKYQQKLLNEGTMTRDQIQGISGRVVGILTDAYERSQDFQVPAAPWLEDKWKGLVGLHEEGVDFETAINAETFDRLGNTIVSLPEDLNIHRRLASKVLKDRKDAVESGVDIDWGLAEHLAYATLLEEGYHVRLSGQDCERGTFSHRHAVLHEQKNLSKFDRPTFRPLDNLPMGRTQFHASNSNLSEFAVLGFEYGYASESPKALVMWEAQFGDFANGAQTIFDQFISSAEQKWLRQNGIVVLLPHGYEGGGPEHSSCRIERFLQMCDEPEDVFPDLSMTGQCQKINWQIVNCTTPANFFHVLRRQMHRNFRKPLIVATPKSGLKHALAVSKKEDFLPGSKFEEVLSDDAMGLPNGLASNDSIRKVVFCSGKIWLDLMRFRVDQANPAKSESGEALLLDDVAVVRLEQISPFPFQRVRDEIGKYPKAEVVWAQEEPRNMGPWSYVAPRFATALRGVDERSISYIGRSAAAAPATGYKQVHDYEQNSVVTEVFD